MEEGWSRPLCALVERQWERLAPVLAADARTEVLSALLTRTLQRVEALLAPKKFNLFGGLFLDKCGWGGVARCCV